MTLVLNNVKQTHANMELAMTYIWVMNVIVIQVIKERIVISISMTANLIHV